MNTWKNEVTEVKNEEIAKGFEGAEDNRRRKQGVLSILLKAPKK